MLYVISTALVLATASPESCMASVLIADQAMAAGGDDEALELYKRALSQLTTDQSAELADELHQRIATLHYEAKRYTEALAALQTADQPLSESAQLLRAQIQQALGDYSAALQSLTALPDSAAKSLQRGQLLFLSNQLEAAEPELSGLTASADPSIAHQANLWLARIDIARGENSEALRRLNDLAADLPPDDPLRYAVAYYKGEAHLASQEYDAAERQYSAAIPRRNATKATWHREALSKQAICQLQTATRLSDAATFQQAEQTLQDVYAQYPSDETALALARCLVARARTLNDPTAQRRVEDLLKDISLLKSDSARVEGRLLLAEVAPTYKLRNQSYADLAQRAGQAPAFMARVLLLRGLNDLEEGHDLTMQGRELEGEAYKERAAAAFAQILELPTSDDQRETRQALKHLALALGNLKSNETRREALAQLDRALNQPDLFSSNDERADLYLLRGQLLAQLGDDPQVVSTALRDVVSHFPQSSVAAKALHCLGLWHYRRGEKSLAEESLKQLLSRYPDSSQTPDALFWSARCAEDLGRSPDVIRPLLQKLYTSYPNSTYAGEAYFTAYPLVAYLSGDSQAVAHLDAMPQRFPDSPYSITANYLRGLKYIGGRPTAGERRPARSSLTQGIEAFQRAEMLFDSLSERQLIPEDQLDYFAALRYRAALDRAQSNLTIAKESEGAKQQIYLEYSTSAFGELLRDLEARQSPAAQLAMRADAYPQLLEESRYGLAQAYLQGEKTDAAEPILQQIVSLSRSNFITRGYFLSRALADLASVNIERGDYATALPLLVAADEAAKGKVLNADEKLSLWIQQSVCHRALGDLDAAMRLLSKVVNDDSVSALRLHAMLLRAEIYEQQGRTELAKKQLTAVARQSGVWAQKAKEKLDKDYGYH